MEGCRSSSHELPLHIFEEERRWQGDRTTDLLGVFKIFLKENGQMGGLICEAPT